MTTSGPGSSEPYEPMPQAPPIYEHEMRAAEPGPRPQSVQTAFLLWMANAGLNLLVGLLGLLVGGTDATRDALRDSLRESGRTATDAEIDAAVNTGLVFGLIIGLVFFGLFLLFAFKMRDGRNWARITLTVLGAISILLSLIGLASAPILSVILTVISVALIGGAIYFMFRPDANEYFQPRRR